MKLLSKHKGLNTVILLCILLPGFNMALAQNKLSEQELMKKFIKINNVCRQQPIHLKVTVSDSTNVALGNIPGNTRQIESYVYPEGSFTRIGSVDQLINDSILVYVRNSIKSITVYPSIQPGTAAGIGLNIPDIKKMLKIYTIHAAPAGKDSIDFSALVVNTKEELGVAKIPARSICMVYNRQTSLPVQVTQTMRSLVKMDSSAYSIMTGDPNNKVAVITAKDGIHYLVLEKMQVYRYNSIETNHTSPLPLTVADCLVKKPDGKFAPSKQFEQYTLKQPFNP